MNMTLESKALFEKIVKDLGNWSNCTPTYNHINAKGRGNLTDLKRKGLVTTYSDGFEWIELIATGKKLAYKLGLGEWLPDSDRVHDSVVQKHLAEQVELHKDEIAKLE